MQMKRDLLAKPEKIDFWRLEERSREISEGDNQQEIARRSEEQDMSISWEGEHEWIRGVERL